MEDELNLYGLGVEWVGERPVWNLAQESPDFRLVTDLWHGVRDESTPPERRKIDRVTVVAVQRVELLGERVLAVLYFSPEEWAAGSWSSDRFVFFLVGQEFLAALERAKEWGAGL